MIPHLTIEFHLRDVDAADVERLLRVLHEMGGVYVVIERPEAAALPMPPDIPAPSGATSLNVTNQQMLNAFYAIASQFDVNGWTLVLKAGLSRIADAREALYSGPALEDLPISEAELRALRAALGLPPPTY